MQMAAGPATGRPGVWLLRRLVAADFAVLAALLVVILAHGLTGGSSLIVPVEALTWAFTALALASVMAGIDWAWKSYPQHRRAVMFTVLITLATLLAHAYVINAPPASTSGSVSGAAGSVLSDSRVTADTSYGDSTLQIVLTANSNAVAQANVTVNGVPLAGGWSTPQPSFADPLQPGTTASGSWQLPPASSQQQVTISYQYLTCYDTSHRYYGCIMDEIFYVPEGMGMLAGQRCSTGAGAPAYCHLEHPPLVPALLAVGMAVFGQYNAVGWRLFPALLGTFSIPLLFGIAWKVSGGKRLAYLSATLLALDVMFFSQSSAGLLDVPEVFFALVAFFVYFAGFRVWKFDRYVLAGVLLGVSGLAKETAIFIALAFVTYVLFVEEGARRQKLVSVLKVALVIGLVFAAGLQAYDSTLATSQYSNFTHNIAYMLSYGSSLIADKLACQPTTGYWCKFPAEAGGPPILPTDWLTYYAPVEYFGVSVCPDSVNGVCRSGTYQDVAYYGVTNLLETWTVYVWVPLVLYAIYGWARKQRASEESLAGYASAPPGAVAADPQGMPGEVKFAALTLTLFLWGYVPYLLLLLAGRVTYPFYIIPAIPAIAMGASFWLSRDWFPKRLLYIYLAMVFVFFFVYFPDKGFLPIWLRILIRH